MSEVKTLCGLFEGEEEQRSACPIRYNHNPHSNFPRFLNRHPQPFPASTLRAPTLHPSPDLSIKLSPLATNASYYSSIPMVYESKFWKDSVEASRTFIHLLAGDKALCGIAGRDGVALSKLARVELRPGFKHRATRATAYMYPFCLNARRLEIIAVTQLLLFVFDDEAENLSHDQMPSFVSDFLAHLEDTNCMPHAPNGPLQHYLDMIIKDIHDLDLQQGNGGQEIHSEMRKHEFTKPVPYDPASASVTQYLAFRHHNICAGFVFACVKFSIGSSVDMAHPRLRTFMTWAADHLCIINDLYSYHKEERDFARGTCPDLINLVAIMQTSLGLRSAEAAIEMTIALGLQRELWMHEELERLERDESVDDEMWEFLSAVWACLSGNVMYSLTCERYGGPGARLRRQGDGTAPGVDAVKDHGRSNGIATFGGAPREHIHEKGGEMEQDVENADSQGGNGSV